MDNSKKIILSIFFYGGLWGFMEATIGYGLHFLPCGFSGMVMFPLGFYCMFSAYQASDYKPVIFYTASIAALIKCADLLIPLRSPMSVLNPAVSILLESLVVFGFVKAFTSGTYYRPALLMSFGWIMLFLLAQQFLLRPADGLYLNPLPVLIGYIALNTLVSGFLIGTYLKGPAWLTLHFKPYHFSYVRSFAIVTIALIFELGNSIL